MNVTNKRTRTKDKIKQKATLLVGFFVALKKIFCIKSLFGASIAVFVLSLFVQLSVSNTLAIKGSELTQLEKEKAVLEKEISELELLSSNYSSLSYIEQKAKELGFLVNTNYVATINTSDTTASISY